jgi:hypothetical protein
LGVDGGHPAGIHLKRTRNRNIAAGGGLDRLHETRLEHFRIVDEIADKPAGTQDQYEHHD